MSPRDARLRTELISLIVLKIGILTILWFLFVKGERVPVDADAMARHAAPTLGLTTTGEPNGH